MTVKIDRKAGKAPRALVDALVAGQAYPFVVTLKHKNKTALVVPSSGINTPIAPGAEPVSIKIKSIEQAWHLVCDLSELAHRADNSAEDFAVLVAPKPVKATKADAGVQE